MGGFQTHISNCSKERVKLYFFFMGASQQKVLQGQEFSGMGCVMIFWEDGKNQGRGGGVQRPPPWFKGLNIVSKHLITRKLKFELRNLDSDPDKECDPGGEHPGRDAADVAVVHGDQHRGGCSSHLIISRIRKQNQNLTLKIMNYLIFRLNLIWYFVLLQDFLYGPQFLTDKL